MTKDRVNRLRETAKAIENLPPIPTWLDDIDTIGSDIIGDEIRISELLGNSIEGSDFRREYPIVKLYNHIGKNYIIAKPMVENALKSLKNPSIGGFPVFDTLDEELTVGDVRQLSLLELRKIDNLRFKRYPEILKKLFS